MSLPVVKPAASTRGRRNGAAANRLLEEDRAGHEWYRFVLSYPPHLVRDYLERFALAPGSIVLDPFCGTGTTVLECKKQGIGAVGIEAHPMSAFASQVKTDWDADPARLVAHAEQVAAEASALLSAQGLDEHAAAEPSAPPSARGLDEPGAADLSAQQPARRLDESRAAQDCEPFSSQRAHGRRAGHEARRLGASRAPGPLLALGDEAARLILKGSISPRPLHRTLTLLGVLDGRRDEDVDRYERLALARALVDGIGNLHFGPEVGVGKPKHDTPAVSLWLRLVRRMARDLEELRRLPGAPTRVACADARAGLEQLPDASVDAVITSPPYPNEKDYTRTTRLESVMLGFVETRAQLRALKRTLVRSNTRGVYRDDGDDAWITGNDRIQRLAARIEKRRLELGKTSGFERLYHRVTRLYFGGMARHLANLRRVLKPGARLAYVVGDQASYLRIMIRTGKLLAEIAEPLGYEVEGIDLFRTRPATATRAQLREEVVILHWRGASRGARPTG